MANGSTQKRKKKRKRVFFSFYLSRNPGRRRRGLSFSSRYRVTYGQIPKRPIAMKKKKKREEEINQCNTNKGRNI